MTHFSTKAGATINAVDAAALISTRRRTAEEFGIIPLQIAESASFSLAMVVRAALGFSASEGRVTVFASDTLTGHIGLATARHLAVAGGSPLVVLVDPPQTPSADLSAHLMPLTKMGIGVCEWTPSEQDSSGDESELRELLEGTHNAIIGLSDILSPAPTPAVAHLINILNDLPTPLHCIEFPPGLDPSTGAGGSTTLYASSTLSLGLPLAGLSKGRDMVGRHYVCDVSIPPTIYLEHGIQPAALFSDQPVVQIFPENVGDPAEPPPETR